MTIVGLGCQKDVSLKLYFNLQHASSAECDLSSHFIYGITKVGLNLYTVLGEKRKEVGIKHKIQFIEMVQRVKAPAASPDDHGSTQERCLR